MSGAYSSACSKVIPGIDKETLNFGSVLASLSSIFSVGR